MTRKLVLGLLVLTWGLAAGAAPFDHGPYAGAPSADSITISWTSSPPLVGHVEIGRQIPDDSNGLIRQIIPVYASDASSRAPVEIVIDRLHSATSYVYRVILQSGSETYVSSIGHFRTEPKPGDPVRFAVLSDTQWQWDGENRLRAVGEAIASDSATSPFDFVLHAGDLVESPAAKYWDHWFASFEPMLLAAPFIPVLGNHEKNSRSYYDAFAHPPGAGQNGERWWALHWGDVVVVGLDTSATRADRILDQQAWAEEQLSGTERHKFVIFHHPVYSSDAYHGSGYGYDKIYHPIFVRHGVDIVFNGHAHNYERIEQDGVIYLVLGGGGAVPRSLAPQRVAGSILALEGRNFYARVATNSNGVAVDIVSVARAAEDLFVLTPNELLDSFFLPSTPEREPLPWETLLVLAAILGGLLWAILRADR